MPDTAPPSRNVLITGGAKRVGSVIARHLARNGYRVVIHFNASRIAAASLCDTICAQGGEAGLVQADLADLEGVPNIIAQATALFGPLDLLVNNASFFGDDRLETLTPALFCANLAINLQAPVLLAQAFAQQLPEGREGAMINLIDQRVLRPNPHYFSYTLAKSALYTATKTLAQALAPRIRVNGIGPGPTLPNVHEGHDAFAREAAGTVLGKAVDPQAIAEAVLFLAQAKHVTGQMLAVDSGQHLGWKTPDIAGS